MAQQTTIIGWQFERLQLSDREMFDRLMQNNAVPMADWYSGFDYLWLRAHGLRRSEILWKMVGDHLAVFEWDRKNRRLALLGLPLGAADPEKLVDLLYLLAGFCQMASEGGDRGNPVMRSIDENHLAYLGRSGRFLRWFRIKQRKGVEHHYSMNKLVALKDKEFAGMRLKLSRLKRHFPDLRVRRYAPMDDREGMIDLYDQWLQESPDQVKDRRDYLSLLDHWQELDHLVLVAELENVLVGMVSGGVRGEQDGWCFMRKGRRQYRGLSELLVTELARGLLAVRPTLEYLNDGSDLGNIGLRQFKQSFRAVRQLKRYRLYLNDPW